MLLNADMRPAFEQDVQQMLVEASTAGVGVEITGGATKRAIGRPIETGYVLSLRQMRGVVVYEPTEMFMSVRAGTRVVDVVEQLARKRQMLAFEPADLAGIVGTDTGEQTMGAVFATNASGARRVLAGGARDHLIGIRAVTGLGEVFKSGGRVMKNVTGYDLSKAVAGSWGTLAALTEVTFKVVPMPEATSTLLVLGLPDTIAVEALCAAMGTPFEVSGAVHLQQSLASELRHAGIASQGKSVTAVRIENTPASIAYRRDRLADLWRPFGSLHDLDTDNSLAFWSELQLLKMFNRPACQVWRVSTAPTRGPQVVEALARYMSVRAFYDWSGGLVWFETPPTADAGAADVRRVIASNGGHATLVRAEAEVRAAVDVFQPEQTGVLKLGRQLKTAFDPGGILNPGRMTQHY